LQNLSKKNRGSDWGRRATSGATKKWKLVEEKRRGGGTVRGSNINQRTGEPQISRGWCKFGPISGGKRNHLGICKTSEKGEKGLCERDSSKS